MEEKWKRKKESTLRSKIFGSQRKKCREGKGGKYLEKENILAGKYNGKEKRENLLETENVTDHQTRIKFHQNLQIQRPGIPVDR